MRAEDAVDKHVALAKLIEPCWHDGQPMFLGRHAVDFNPSQRSGSGLVKAVEKTLQFGGTDRQKVARTPVKQAIGVEQLHRIASRRPRQRQCGDIESVAESIFRKLGLAHLDILAASDVFNA
ncbi:MAG: hypothetical protein KA538_11205 [Azonexus sp.]|nr:hypothetical protein [Azonexus sp.]